MILYEPVGGALSFCGEDLSYYRDNFEVYDESRNLNIQKLHTAYEVYRIRIIMMHKTTKEVRMHVHYFIGKTPSK